MRLFRAAVAAADPAVVVPPHLPSHPLGRTIVVGAGKAAAAMARAAESAWDGPLSGLVITRYGHAVPCERIEVVEAAHPVPDEAGTQAADRILGLVSDLTADDLVLCLISGGGSSLLSLPAAGVSLDDKRAVSTSLLKCCATIAEINCVRKHLSVIKGGRLAVACYPARVCTLAISDVPGDDPSTIASGPTVADPTTFADALFILERYGVEVPATVLEHLQRGAEGGCGAPEESPKPGDPRLTGHVFEMVATPGKALAAAAGFARDQGVAPVMLGDCNEGESRVVARAHASLALAYAQPDVRWQTPCVLISGGETTVTVCGHGRGGRNAEYLLALALELDGCRNVSALAADTDGIDGSQDNAGAVVAPDTLIRAHSLDMNPAAMLDDNDAYTLFERLGDLVVTGPTRTNVNDFRAILIQ